MRAECAPGYDRINALTLLAVVQAVCSILPPTDALIVVGHDARLHSRKFAVLIADICLTQKARVCLFSRPVPTPLVAFAARRMEACVAFCVTASHNPPLDNGLKIFWNDAIQIRPRVAERIERAIPECARPYKVYALTEQDFTPGHLTDPYDDMSDAYVENMASLRLRTLSQNAAAPQVVYTACHGVGYQLVCHLFKAFGLQSPIACVQQCNPDPTFPTLPFPNPEEKGALDLALATARQEGVKIVLANDPDADRLGAAELQHDGTARVFTGDEIAVLLTDYLVSMCGESDYSKLAVVGSTVSSKMIDCMAKKRGFLFREALTGFKWLNKEAVQLEEQGYTVLLTYEEAIGYNVSRNLVRDKDGVSAAAVFAEMAGYIYEKKSTIARRLQQLLVECGQHISHNGYLRLSDASPSTTAIFDAARLAGLPSSFGVAHVMSVRDLTNGSDTAEKDGLSRLPADSKSQFLTFRCAKNPNDHLVCPLILHLRGSGTGMSHLCVFVSKHMSLVSNRFFFIFLSRTKNQVLCRTEMHKGRSTGWCG